MKQLEICEGLLAFAADVALRTGRAVVFVTTFGADVALRTEPAVAFVTTFGAAVALKAEPTVVFVTTFGATVAAGDAVVSSTKNRPSTRYHHRRRPLT